MKTHGAVSCTEGARTLHFTISSHPIRGGSAPNNPQVLYNLKPFTFQTERSSLPVRETTCPVLNSSNACRRGWCPLYIQMPTCTPNLSCMTPRSTIPLPKHAETKAQRARDGNCWCSIRFKECHMNCLREYVRRGCCVLISLAFRSGHLAYKLIKLMSCTCQGSSGCQALPDVSSFRMLFYFWVQGLGLH